MYSQSYYTKYETLSKEFAFIDIKGNSIVDSLIQLSNKTKKFSESYKISHDYSLKCYLKQNYDDALRYAQLAVSIKEKINEHDHDFINSLYRVGVFSSKIPNYNTSLEAFNKIIEYDINPLKIALSLNKIGYINFLTNDYYKAIDYYKRGIKRLEGLEHTQDLLNAYEQICIIYNEIGTYESLRSQEEVLKKVDSLKEFRTFTLDNHIRFNNSYVALYSSDLLFDFKEAKYYLNENLRLSKKNNIDYILGITYNNLANIYNLKQKDSALFFANKALKYSLNDEGYVLSHFQKSEYYYTHKNYDSALQNIQLSINKIIRKNKDYKDLIRFNQISDNYDKDQLLLMLIQKIKLIYSQSLYTSDTKMLKLALQHILVSDSLIDNIQQKTINKTKFHWRVKASEIYTQGIRICYELNKSETAFYLSEKGKALLLTESIINNNSFSKLPLNIKLKEKELRRKIIDEQKLSKGEKSFDLKIKHQNFIDSIKKSFTNYYKNQSLQKIITLSQLQDDLSENKVVASYLWPSQDNKSSLIYGLFITKNSIDLKPLSVKDNFKTLFDLYYSLINKPFKNLKDKNEFNRISSQLYKLLLPKDILVEGKELIIIPDGNIHRIPFESLIIDSDSNKYLIEATNISYAYSMSFLKYNSSLERNTNNNILAIAPSTFKLLNLKPIKNSAVEAESIENIINGKLFIKNQGTISNFKNYVEDSKIIHLATHAEAGESPWIAFSDKKMTLEELYNSKNSADLTVLSSCNSSIGEMADGEGVMSLARGFFYSGSNSVVASLWSVNDKSTSILMEYFYQNLKSGETKSEALRNAKLQYLKSANLSEASPYYWSSFILLGNTNKIEFVNYSIYYIITFCCLTILMISFILYKKIFRKD